MRLLVLRIAHLLCCCGLVWWYQPALAATDNARAADQLFILDASGSMWGQIEGKNKIVIAREVMAGLIEKLPDDSHAGLVAYGHRRKADCADIETLALPGPLDKAALTATINGLNPKGKTPITASIQMAFELVRGRDTAANIILVSDGLETCGGDPCQAVKEARAAGIDFVMHVVGFGIERTENVSSLECAAQAGGGLYFDANNADELSQALQQAVEQPLVLSGGRLAVKAIANSELADVSVTITALDSGAEVAYGRTYRSQETNPRTFLLPPGRYRADVTALQFKGDITRQLTDIVIVEDETVAHVVDFSTGTISIKALRNGSLSDAAVSITRAGDDTSVAAGRTYISASSNPANFNLTPGTYDIAVVTLELKGGAQRTFQSIEIKAGDVHEEVVDFSSGEISVKVLINGQPGDATVKIHRAEDGKYVAGGRTYTSADHNPQITAIAPGLYDIAVQPVAFKGAKQQIAENLEVKPGETAAQTFTYSSGTLAVKVTENGQRHDAIVSIYDSEADALVASGRTYTGEQSNPAHYAIATGTYDVVIKPLHIQGNPPHRIENAVVSEGQTIALAHDYRTGSLAVVSVSGTLAADSMINVVDTASGRSMASKRSYGKTLVFNLLPGEYLVKAKALKVPGARSSEQKVIVEAGKQAEVKADFPATAVKAR